MCDVVVIGDTAILRHLLMIGRHQDMSLITVSQIGAVHRIVEVGCALTLIVSAAVEIVELESHTYFLACVHTEPCRQVVFSVCSVTAIVVGEIREWR